MPPTFGLGGRLLGSEDTIMRTLTYMRRYGVVLCVFFVIIAVALPVTAAYGDQSWWDAPSGGGYYDPENWDPIAVPASDANVNFSLGGDASYDVSFDANATSYSAYSFDDVMLVLNGWDYNVTSDVELWNASQWIVSNGRLIVGNHLSCQGGSIAVLQNGEVHASYATFCEQVLVDGSGALLSIDGRIEWQNGDVGKNFVVRNGGQVQAGGELWTNMTPVGQIQIETGGQVSVGSVDFGAISVQGTNSRLDVAGNAFTYMGSLTVSDDAVVVVGGQFWSDQGQSTDTGLSLAGGATFSADSVQVTPSIAVDGAGTVLNTNDLNTNSDLLITGGGEVVVGWANARNVYVDGGGSIIESGWDFWVQDNLEITGGGEAIVGSADARNVYVDGGASRLESAGSLRVQDDLEITGGGRVNVQTAYVGPGYPASVTVQGAGSDLTATDELIVMGDLLVTDQAEVTARELEIVDGDSAVSNGGRLTVTEELFIEDGEFVVSDGGTLSVTGEFNLSDATFQVSSGATVNISASVFCHQSSIEVDGASLELGDSSSEYGFVASFSRIVATSGADVTLNSRSYSGIMAVSITDSVVRAPNGLSIATNGFLSGRGQVIGPVSTGTGSTIYAEGGLDLGDVNAVDGVALEGRLYVDSHTVTLRDRNEAVLGSLTTLGNPGTGIGGRLLAENGFLLQRGRNLSGFGSVEGAFENNGDVYGGTEGKTLEFTELVTGIGDFHDHVTFSGGYSPGMSPVQAGLDDMKLAATNALTMELGGTTAGNQYDQLIVSGTAELDGDLDVTLIYGFAPKLGDAFTLIDGSALSGEFSNISLPLLAGGLDWAIIQTEDEFTLKVALLGDVDLSGVVDAADYIALKRHAGAGSAAVRADGDLDRDGDVDWNDLQLLTANYGRTSADAPTAIPEPATLFVMMAAGLPALLRRRRSRS